MSKIALLFPGQGSQSVGMGKDLYENHSAARQIMDQFNQWVMPELTEIMFNGPEDTLKRTLYTQPAILAVSLAAFTALSEKAHIQPVMAAGHSLGEYGALYAAGVIDLETAARLVKKRAELMESAPAGAMAAILALNASQVETLVEQVRQQGIGIVAVANYNTPEQYVISGEKAAVDAACALAKETGGKAISLPVGGAFHSPLMQPASDAFKATLSQFAFHDAAFPVVTNVDAQVTTQGTPFQAKLADQIFSSVRWTDTIRLMRQQGVETFIEVGPGKVLAGMIKKIDREALIYNVFDMASLTQTVEAVQERIHA